MKMMFREVMEDGGYAEKNFELSIDRKKYWFMLRSSLMSPDSPARFLEWVDGPPPSLIIEGRAVSG